MSRRSGGKGNKPTFTRQVPKFLAQYESMLGGKPQEAKKKRRPGKIDDDDDPPPTIANPEEGEEIDYNEVEEAAMKEYKEKHPLEKAEAKKNLAANLEKLQKNLEAKEPQAPLEHTLKGGRIKFNTSEARGKKREPSQGDEEKKKKKKKKKQNTQLLSFNEDL